MQSREKLLAGILGACVLLLLFAWLFIGIKGVFVDRGKTLRSLKSQVATMEDLRAERNTMHKNLRRVLEQSLPADVGKAQALYSTWLSGLVKSKDVDLRNPSVRTLNPLPGVGFTRLKFEVKGNASLERVTRLLHEFYSTDLLHKITLLQLTPLGKTKDLDVTISIEALSLADTADHVFPTVKKALAKTLKVDEKKVTAEATLTGDLGAKSIGLIAASLAEAFGVKMSPKELVPDPTAETFPDAHTVQTICESVETMLLARKHSPRLELGDWNAYKDRVVRRNFFDYNRSPEWGNTRFTATIGRPFRESLRASDPDQNKLKYELKQGTSLPPGMTFEGSTLLWSPDAKLEPTTYRFTVCVTDDGDPPIRVERGVTVSLQRPAAPPPARKEFDHARFAFLVGLPQLNGRPEAWIKVRTLDQELRLIVGEKAKIGQREFKVLEIDLKKRTMVIEFSDYRRTVHLGESLVDGREGV